MSCPEHTANVASDPPAPSIDTSAVPELTTSPTANGYTSSNEDPLTDVTDEIMNLMTTMSEGNTSVESGGIEGNGHFSPMPKTDAHLPNEYEDSTVVHEYSTTPAAQDDNISRVYEIVSESMMSAGNLTTTPNKTTTSAPDLKYSGKWLLDRTDFLSFLYAMSNSVGWFVLLQTF